MKTIKKLLLIILAIACLVAIFQAGIFRSIVMFLLIGAIPGTTLSLSADTMAGIIVLVSTLLTMSAFGMVLPRLVAFYRRNILRKKLLTIPAFRRLLHTHQA